MQTVLVTDDEVSNADSCRSRRSHSVGGGPHGVHSRHSSSNCLNMSDDPQLDLSGGHGPLGDHHAMGGSHVRRSASGVFRYPHEHCGDEDDDDCEDEMHGHCDDDPRVDEDEDDLEGEHHLQDNQYLIQNGFKSDLTDYDHYPDDSSLFHTPRDPFNGLTRQMNLMNKNLNSKLDELHGYQPVHTTAALTEIRSQLHELTRSVENCQSEVYEVKQDMISIKQEIDSVQFVKDEIDDIRESIDRMESEGERRKAKLLEQGLTFHLGFSIFAAVLGMLQFGYNTGVINAPESVIEKFIRFAYRKRYNGENMTYEASTFLYAIAVAIFALGGMLGGFTGGWIANKFGRRGGLIVTNVVGIIGATGMGMAKFAESYELLILGRFLIGVNCGLNTSLVPMYISEIAPLTLRGGLGTVNQLAVTVGLLISQILGIESLLGTDNGWPYLLGIAIFPCAIQLVLLPMCPESPRFLLITKQQEGSARIALKKLRHSNDIEDDIAEMRAEEQAQKSESQIRMIELIRSPTLRLPLLIAIVMQLSQQLSGINAVFYYSTNLFITTGLSESHAKFATIGIGTVMVIMTLISIPLMDRSGRRTLHLYGLGGMFIFSIFITISFLVKELVAWIWWLSVVSTLFYVVFFAVGPGSIPWMITAELFSQGPRPAAMSVAVLINWCANFLVGIGFPTMQTSLENYTFLPFSVFLAIFWIFTYRKVPETKNKTFDEIATLFRLGHKQRAMMNCVNSMPSLNGGTCEHKTLLPPSGSAPGMSVPMNQPPPAQQSHPQTPSGPQTPHSHPHAHSHPQHMSGDKPEGHPHSVQEYPLLVDSYPSSPRSRSEEEKSPSQMSDYSIQLRNSSSQILSPAHSDMEFSPQESVVTDGHPPPPPHGHAAPPPPPPHQHHPGQQPPGPQQVQAQPTTPNNIRYYSYTDQDVRA